MIVVSDAGPVQYLSRIGVIDLLPLLYQRVLVPFTVAKELQQDNTPGSVRAWIAKPPSWCEIRPDPPADPTLAFLDPGERAAIGLIQLLRADLLLMDEWEGRREAERRNVPVTGTLGLLACAHLAGSVDFEQALVKLRQTNFYISDEVIERVRQDLTRASGRSSPR